MSKKRVAALVQCIASDLFSSKDEKDYCIAELKKSNLFSDIVIAVPDIESSHAFDKVSELWGVKVYYGSVFNVAERFYNAAKSVDADIIVRIQLRAFYADIDMIRKMIKDLGDTYDYIDFDNEVNYTLFADVFTTKALERALTIIDKMPESFCKDMYKFAPWAMFSTEESFRVKKITYQKSWSKDKVKAIRKKLADLRGEDENKYFTNINNPASRYQHVKKYLKSSDSVLDIACGQGDGAALLAESTKLVYGIDYNADYIKSAQDRFNRGNLKFVTGTHKAAEELGIKFDKIISFHTLEHVEDDIDFLKTLNASMSQEGKLILEIPKSFKYPLGEPLIPHHKKEYTLQDIQKIINDTGFKVETMLGGSRNLYVDIKDAREILFFVCGKKK